MTAGRRRGGVRRDEKFAQDCAQEARDGGMVGEKREKKNRRDKGEEKYSYRGYNCILDYNIEKYIIYLTLLRVSFLFSRKYVK